MHYTAKFWEHPPPSRSSSSCSRKSPAVPSHPVWVSREGHRNLSSSTPWSSSPTSCPWSRFWTFLCHRWVTSWWLRSSTSTRRFPSRLPQCPRSRCHPVVLARFSGSRRRRSSLWKCRLSCLFPLCSRLPSRSLTFQFLALVVVVIVEVFTVFPQDKFRRSVLCRRSSTFLLVVVFKIFSLILGCQPHPQSRVMRRFNVFFALSPISKKCTVRREVECEGCTRTRAHGRQRREVQSEEEDPDRWVDEYGRLWQRSVLFLRRWQLLGTGMAEAIYWHQPGWGSLGSWRTTWSAAYLSGLPSCSEAFEAAACGG